MPTNLANSQDHDLDPLETADQEEDAEETDSSDSDDSAGNDDSEKELEEEIGKVAVEEDSEPSKQKPHMIPRDLIDRELSAEDLWDEGEI